VRHLAQVNVALMRHPLDHPDMRAFTDALASINRLAELSPGFVWRLPGAHEHAPVVVDDGVAASVVNVSVWTDYASLHDFTYRSAHGRFLRGRAAWFLPTPQPSTALWWVPVGARPGTDEALARLAHLRAHGPTPRAFGVRRRFEPDGRPVPHGPPPRSAASLWRRE
jgi:hypothetical protein